MMNFLERIGVVKRQNSAQIAKERLQIILAHERAHLRNSIDLEKLKEEILSVLKKYFFIQENSVQVNYENQGEFSVLELNVTVPEPSDTNKNGTVPLKQVAQEKSRAKKEVELV